MAIITSSLPDFGNSKGTDEKIEVLLNSYYQLRKEIEYALQNVDFSNLSTDLSNRLKKINEELKANSTDLNNAINAIGDLETAIADGVITTYYQADEPDEAKTGDLWFNTATEKLYRYNGTDFDLIEDKGITDAVQAAQNAQDTADGKITSFYQDNEPIEGMSKGDLWIDTNNHNKLYRYNGTLWQAANDGRIENVVDANGKLLAEKIQGIINTAVAMVQNGNGTVSFDDRGLIVHNQPTELSSTKAVLISSVGILIANSKDALGNWVWRTAVTGDSISADQITTGILKAINIEGVNITGSIMDVRHNDGSHTMIDGRGITRQLSIPIFEQMPSDADIIETFESGVLANTRVDMANSYWGYWIQGGYNPVNYIKLTTEDKFAGNYSLKIDVPDGTSEEHYRVQCYFINYRPTKNSNITLKYKTALTSTSYARMSITDMDTAGGATQNVALNSSTWATASLPMLANKTYRLGIYIENQDANNDNAIYIDDIVFEEDVNEPIIVGYEQSEQPYYDFTYIRKGSFTGSGVQQIILPDYFRGLNYDVYVMPTGNFKWGQVYDVSVYGDPVWSFDSSSIEVSAINNTVPSFTVEYINLGPSGTPTDFIYTVILED